MTEDKCPFCGAEKSFNGVHGPEFICHTGSRGRSDRCYERQISQLQEKLEAWRLVKSGIDDYWTELDPLKAIQKLRDLGEI